MTDDLLFTPAVKAAALIRAKKLSPVEYVDAVLKGTPGDPDEIRARMEALVAQRESTQPVRSKTGGSTFTNPPGHKAWQLIDQAGCRGLMHGAAQVSEKHCNFLINTGDATATDIKALGEDVRARVKAKFGIELEWEIKRIGRAKETAT